MFTSILAVSQVLLFTSIYLRFKLSCPDIFSCTLLQPMDDHETVGLLTREQYYYIAFGLSLLSVGSYFGLMHFCMPDYRSTFYAFTTSRQFQKKRFHCGSNETKYKILTTTHEVTWRSFKKDIQIWLDSVWTELHTNRPEWFTEASIANIPSDMIPGDEVSDENFSRFQNRPGKSPSRRRSFINGLGLETSEDVKKRRESQTIEAKFKASGHLVIMRDGSRGSRGVEENEDKSRPKIFASRRNSMVSSNA